MSETSGFSNEAIQTDSDGRLVVSLASNPLVVTGSAPHISDEDVERIARRVVQLLKLGLSRV